MQEARCGISNIASRLDLGRLDQPGRTTLNFTIDCNAPFGYAITSKHGALIAGGAANAGDRSVPAIPYEITTSIPTTDGLVLSDTCGSASLRAGAQACDFSTSGNAIALREAAALTVAWHGAGAVPAGRYEDALTLTLSPQP